MNRMQKIAARQQGAALIVALIVMALVSVLGLSALRSSMFSGKVATSVQADAMTYEAAETAINLTYSQLGELSTRELSTQLAKGDVYSGCVSAGTGSFGNSCGSADTLEGIQDCLCQMQGSIWLDARELLKSRSRTVYHDEAPISGSDNDGPDSAGAESVARSGSDSGSSQALDIVYYIIGEGSFSSLGLENDHYLKTVKRVH